MILLLAFFLIPGPVRSNGERLIAGTQASDSPRKITVAAAADLRNGFAELIPIFERSAGVKVEVIYGSSGLLAKQAGQGAPYDALFSANESYIDELDRAQKLIPGSKRLYARGRIAVYA